MCCPTRIEILHAGSLGNYLKVLKESYEAARPGATVLLEGGGSIEAIDKVVRGGRRADIVASADAVALDILMTGKHSDWSLAFAGNAMVLAYTDASKWADRLDAGNWLDILCDPAVATGGSDPEADPGGYRAYMVMRLAERHYGRSGAFEAFSKKHRVYPYYPDDLRAGRIDYAFGYRSGIKTFGYRSLELPPELNLEKEELARIYAGVSTRLSDGVVIPGSPLRFGLTVPRIASNPEAAIDFISYAGSRLGRELLARAGFRVLWPMQATNPEALPSRLRDLAEL